MKSLTERVGLLECRRLDQRNRHTGWEWVFGVDSGGPVVVRRDDTDRADDPLIMLGIGKYEEAQAQEQIGDIGFLPVEAEMVLKMLEQALGATRSGREV
jgi:hypothetical protein